MAIGNMMNVKVKSTRLKIAYKKLRFFEKSKGLLLLPNSIKIGALVKVSDG